MLHYMINGFIGNAFVHIKSDGLTFQWAVYMFCLICFHAVPTAVRADGLIIPPVMSHANSAQPPVSGSSPRKVGRNPAVVPVHAVVAPSAFKPVRQPAAGFTFTVAAVNHPCGIFQVNQPGSVNLLIRNGAAQSLVLQGQLFWNQLPYSENAPGSAAPSDALSPTAGDGHSPAIFPTAIRPTAIQPGNAMQIILPVRFAQAGRYVLVWRHGEVIRGISQPFPVILRPHGGTLPVADSRWISLIPAAFYKSASAGYISDYMRQTGIRRYLADIAIGRPSTASGAIPNATVRLMRIVKVIHKLGGQVVVRLNLFCKNEYRRSNPRRLAASLAPILKRLSPDISAIVVNPIGLNVSSRMALALRGVQLAAAQRAYRHIADMAAKILPIIPVVPQLKSLGADSYCPLDPDLLSESFLKTKSLIFAVSDRRRWLAFMHTVSRLAHPPLIWVLPKSVTSMIETSRQIGRAAQPCRSMGAAMALAAGATFAPAREGNCFSVTAHWLGDAAPFARVHSHLPPAMTVFQANQRAVAIVTSLGAGTIHDNLWRAWKRGHVQWRRVGPASGGGANSGWHHLSVGYFPTGHLTIYDPESVLQSFNAAGQKLPTPFPGEQQIPLNSKVYFVTAPGSARNLVAALRTAKMHGFPPVLMFPQLFATRKFAGHTRAPGTNAGQTAPEARRFTTTDSNGHTIGGLQVRWVIRNAGMGRLEGLFRTSILAVHEGDNRSAAKSIAHTTWRWLEIPSGQFRTLSIKIPNNVSGNGLILRASFHGAGFHERVTLPLAAVAQPAEPIKASGSVGRN